MSVRYGAKLRKFKTKAINSKIERYSCPKCAKKKVKRVSYAIWQCKSCKAKIAGGAYSLTTDIGSLVSRIIKEYKKG